MVDTSNLPLLLLHMSKKVNESPLMAKMRKDPSDLSLIGPKPQDLPYDELKERLKAFMLKNERMSMIMAFGEGADKDEVSEGVKHFDPCEEFKKDESRLEEIMMLVEHDMDHREKELLEEAQRHASSYNVLMFGAAIKIARGDQLSDDLKELIVTHLTNPPDRSALSKGRPKRDPLVDERKGHAIKFAMLHGLKRTRNEGSLGGSACDLVAEAALELRKMGYPNFETGYGYETLRKIKP